MRLVELRPQLLAIEGDRYNRYVETIGQADGLIFLCPICFVANAGPIGTHSVICWRPRVPAEREPGPGRWELVGSGFDDLSLVAGSSSVLVMGGCNAHFYVRSGEIVIA